jgi:hypothetical protein
MIDDFQLFSNSCYNILVIKFDTIVLKVVITIEKDQYGDILQLLF